MMGFWNAAASAGTYTQTVCTSLQTDNHNNTSSVNFFTGQMLFLTPNQQCQSTEGNPKHRQTTQNIIPPAQSTAWTGS